MGSVTQQTAVAGGQGAKNGLPSVRAATRTRPASGRFRRGETGETAVVLNLMLIGLAITLDPLPLTAFMVILPSKRGVRKGAAFVFGWLVSLAIVVTVTVLATGNNPPKPNTAPSLASLAVRTAIGTLLVWIAIRQRRRTRGPKKPPKWQEHVDNMSPWFAMTFAPTLQPWALIGAGAATVMEAKLSSWESYLALFGFCVLASASYLAMEIYAGFKPDQSEALLARTVASPADDLSHFPHGQRMLFPASRNRTGCSAGVTSLMPATSGRSFRPPCPLALSVMSFRLHFLPTPRVAPSCMRSGRRWLSTTLPGKRSAELT